MSKSFGICTRRFKPSSLCGVVGENASHEGTKTRRRHESEANRAERLTRRAFLSGGEGGRMPHTKARRRHESEEVEWCRHIEQSA